MREHSKGREHAAASAADFAAHYAPDRPESFSPPLVLGNRAVALQPSRAAIRAVVPTSGDRVMVSAAVGLVSAPRSEVPPTAVTEAARHYSASRRDRRARDSV
jgi:hypothetical protein